MKKMLKAFVVLVLFFILVALPTRTLSAEYCEDHDNDVKTPQVCTP